MVVARARARHEACAERQKAAREKHADLASEARLGLCGLHVRLDVVLLLLLDLVAEGVELVLLGERGRLGRLLLRLLARLLGRVHPLGARDRALAVDDRAAAAFRALGERDLVREGVNVALQVDVRGRRGLQRVVTRESTWLQVAFSCGPFDFVSLGRKIPL